MRRLFSAASLVVCQDDIDELLESKALALAKFPYALAKDSTRQNKVDNVLGVQNLFWITFKKIFDSFYNLSKNISILF